MKNIKSTLWAIVILVSISVAAQSQQNGVSLDFDNYKANTTLLKEYVKAMNDEDAKKLNAFFTDDAIITGLGSSNDTLSKKQHLQQYIATFEQNDLTVTDDIYLSLKTDKNATVAPGEYAFSWGRVFSQDKITKKYASVSYHLMAKIVNGKITVLWHYYDTLPFVIKAGYEFIAASKVTNVDVISGLYSAFTTGDIPEVLKALDAKVEWNEAEGNKLAAGNPYIGPDAVLKGVFSKIDAHHEYFNLTDIKLHQMSDNKVLATLRYAAKVKETGNVYNAQAAHLWTLKNGKVIAFQQYVDTKKIAAAETK